MKIKNTLKYLKSVLPRYIDLRVLKRIQSKFSVFADLLLRDQQYRKEKVIAHPFPGLGPDIDPEVVRPWRKIPNVRNFRITLRPLDWLMLLFRFSKRSVPLLEFGSWKNAPRNQYIDYMFTRLREQVVRKEFEKASETVGILMNSTSYKVAGFNSVMRNWHRKYPLWQLEVWRDEIGRLIRERATKIDYSRVYMQEPDKLRPLGVPTVPGRVYLHMYNNLLTEGRLVTETGKQHGYLPGRGVQTAGGALAKRLSSPNIYEADFKGFFDNVTHDGIVVEMCEIGLPPKELDFMCDLMESVPKLPGVVRLRESDSDLIGQTCLDGLPEWCDSGPSEGVGSIWDEERFLRGSPSWDSIPDLKSEDGLSVVGDAVIANELSADPKYRKEIGVPQGAPISCSVATLTLRDLEKKEDILLYADDILGFPSDTSREPSEILNSPDRGVLVKDKKTRWLKIDGKGIVESFKFLGIRYYPPRTHEVHIPLRWISYFKSSPLPWSGLNMLKYTVRLPETFEADTRKGAKLVFTRREAFLSYLYKSREILLLGGSAGNQFMNLPLSEWLAWNLSKFEKLRSAPKLLGNNPLTGWFTARMFCDSGDLKTKQDFTLTYRKDSWMAYRWPLYCLENNMEWEQISIFTASSFACDDLASMIDKPYKYRPKKKNRFRKIYPRGKPVGEDTNLEPGQWAEQIARGMGRRLKCYGPDFYKDS